MKTLEKKPPVLNPVAQQVWHQRLRRSGFFLAAVLMHLVLFSLIATWVIFRSPPPEQEASFKGVSIPVKVPPPPTPPASGDAANNPQLEPQTVVVPVVTPPTAITTTVSSFKVDASKVVDSTLNHIPSPVVPQGAGLGTTGGGGNVGSGSDYGSGTGSSLQLVGHLYDLKQTPDRQPTNIAASDPKGATNGLNFLRSFVKDWNMTTLANYYQAPGTIYASQVCIRERHSDESTKAFGVAGIVQPLRWIIVYDATVTAPEAGTYRFVGWADDFLVVRWNGDNVLDASYPSEELDPSAISEKITSKDGDQTLKYGKWIQMDAGTPVPMKILIGEGPGGYSGFLLMVQKQGDESPNGDYPIFQVQDASVPDLGGGFQKITKKKILFKSASSP